MLQITPINPSRSRTLLRSLLGHMRGSGRDDKHKDQEDLVDEKREGINLDLQVVIYTCPC
jgi:hypothetical protein